MPKAIESPVQIITVASNTLPMPIETPGPALQFVSSPGLTSTPSTLQTLINQTPSGTTVWRLRRVELISRAYAVWQVKIGSTVLHVAKTGPAESNIFIPIEPWEQVAAPNALTVTYEQDTGPSVPIEARAIYTIS